MAAARQRLDVFAIDARRQRHTSRGGAIDAQQPVARNRPNHAVAVNQLLGHEDRVAMTNRPGHSPTEESNEQVYRFLEHVLKPRQGTRGR